ncbi:MAG TPA: RagB/SusD family nutrient uptake outer membrane protein, partial [Bacteroidales bacterium]
IRYADVLLMAAELGSANAQSYFDQVRQRAYKDNFSALTVSKDNILKERRLEFSGEGIRYWDMLRQGITTAASIVNETATVLNGGEPATKIVKGDRLITTKGLQQIPKTQITLSNNVLVQNPGW